MRIAKSKVERWCRAYDKFALECCWWIPAIVVFVCVLGLFFTPTNSIAARAVTGLMGLAVGSLFIIMGLYSLSAGISLYFRRIATTVFGAYFGLAAGFLFGVFTALLGTAGSIAILRHALSH